jgi:hypothetical protein
MASRPKVNWRVPSEEWDRFIEYIHRKYGRVEGHVGREVDLTMREWVDVDGYSEVEELVDRLVRAAGRTPESISEKKLLSSPIVDGDDSETVNVQCRVDPGIKDDFRAFVKEHSDDRLGIALARALRERREGGRPKRLEEKLDRVVDDAEELLSEIAGDGEKMSLRKKRTIKICRRFSDSPQVTTDDLHDAIEDIAGETVIEDYEQRVLDRMGYAQHPSGSPLYMPVDEARELAEKLDLPGPDAPAIDKKDYAELSNDERVNGLRIELIRRADPRGGRLNLTTKTIREDVFGYGPSDSHTRELMREAAQAEGFDLGKSVSGLDVLKVNVDLVNRDLCEDAGIIDADTWSAAPPNEAATDGGMDQ